MQPVAEALPHPKRDELELAQVLHALSDPVRLQIVASIAPRTAAGIGSFPAADRYQHGPRASGLTPALASSTPDAHPLAKAWRQRGTGPGKPEVRTDSTQDEAA